MQIYKAIHCIDNTNLQVINYLLVSEAWEKTVHDQWFIVAASTP